jgi:hypothetical protein
MDKKITIILICGFVVYLVFLLINYKSVIGKQEETVEINTEEFNKENNIVLNKIETPIFKKLNKTIPEEISELKKLNKIDESKKFDPYEFYTSLNKLDVQEEFTKENFDYGIDLNEYYSNKNLLSQSVKNMRRLKRTATYFETEPVNERKESSNWISQDEDDNLLVPNNLEPNFIYSVPFPENTSIELANFTAENVTDLYDANNMEDLYNNINSDVYRGYKTLKYML